MNGETYIDLIDYIKIRARCSTGMAERMVLAGCITVDDEVVGVDTSRGRPLLSHWIPSNLRDKIKVQMPTTDHIGNQDG